MFRGTFSRLNRAIEVKTLTNNTTFGMKEVGAMKTSGMDTIELEGETSRGGINCISLESSLIEF